MKTDKCLVDLGLVEGEAEPMAVIVGPWPKDCGHCRMLCKDEDLNEHFCYIQDSLTKRIEAVNSKPDWCPLRPLPERRLYDGSPYLEPEYVAGWNACLEAIIREVEA